MAITNALEPRWCPHCGAFWSAAPDDPTADLLRVETLDWIEVWNTPCVRCAPKQQGAAERNVVEQGGPE